MSGALDPRLLAALLADKERALAMRAAEHSMRRAALDALRAEAAALERAATPGAPAASMEEARIAERHRRWAASRLDETAAKAQEAGAALERAAEALRLALAEKRAVERLGAAGLNAPSR